MEEAENSPARQDERVDCVGVICFRGGEVLLIKRGKAPRQGDWSLPGGRIERGETQEQAALRELKEETGVTADLGVKIATIDADFEGHRYRLHDFVAHWTAGEPKAGDDATDAAFFTVAEISKLGMWGKTERVIQEAFNHLLLEAENKA